MILKITKIILAGIFITAVQWHICIVNNCIIFIFINVCCTHLVLHRQQTNLLLHEPIRNLKLFKINWFLPQLLSIIFSIMRNVPFFHELLHKLKCNRYGKIYKTSNLKVLFLLLVVAWISNVIFPLSSINGEKIW